MMNGSIRFRGDIVRISVGFGRGMGANEAIGE